MDVIGLSRSVSESKEFSYDRFINYIIIIFLGDGSAEDELYELDSKDVGTSCTTEVELHHDVFHLVGYLFFRLNAPRLELVSSWAWRVVNRYFQGSFRFASEPDPGPRNEMEEWT